MNTPSIHTLLISKLSYFTMLRISLTYSTIKISTITFVFMLFYIHDIVHLCTFMACHCYNRMN